MSHFSSILHLIRSAESVGVTRVLVKLVAKLRFGVQFGVKTKITKTKTSKHTEVTGLSPVSPIFSLQNHLKPWGAAFKALLGDGFVS